MSKPTKPRPHPAPVLKAAGEALWGPQYRSEMARSLDVHVRTAMRWDRGETAVPQETWRGLADLLRERQTEIDKVLARVLAKVED